MSDKLLQNGLTIRGDSIYCPLSLSLDSYGNCLTDCHHCYLRNLNHVWGTDLKPLDLEKFERRLVNGLSNKNPKSPLAWALKQKKAIRFGNKADPFQDAELEHNTSFEVLKILWKHKWFTVIQTMHTETMMKYEYQLKAMRHQIIVQPIISPGWISDWAILEQRRTTHPWQRLEHIRELAKMGISVAVNGEPFIPGYHTYKNFKTILQLLKEFGINRYNVYNFHFNAFVAKRLHAIGIDIEKIWFYNKDERWSHILQHLLDIAKQENIILGCPDFVNAGIDYVQNCNTCCGIDVPNPTLFNTHTWIRMIQEGKSLETILQETWDGVGDYEQGKKVLMESSSKFYTINDARRKSNG